MRRLPRTGGAAACLRREGISTPRSGLAKGGSQSFHQLWFLFGEDGAEIEDEPIVFDAGDYADACGAAEALLELRGGVACAGDADDLGGKGLRGRGTATGQRGAVGDFEFDFAGGEFGGQFAEKIFGAAIELVFAHANHA